MLRWFDKSSPEKRRLGPLEGHLLRALWKRGDATVRELLDAGEVRSAYTTVMTTLDRLYKKGILERKADGRNRAFRYRPRQTQQDFYRSLVGADLRRLLDSAPDPSAPVSFLVDEVSEHDAALLDELTRAVQRKRRELRKGGKP